jgi:hypothetical protein
MTVYQGLFVGMACFALFFLFAASHYHEKCGKLQARLRQHGISIHV